MKTTVSLQSVTVSINAHTLQSDKRSLLNIFTTVSEYNKSSTKSHRSTNNKKAHAHVSFLQANKSVIKFLSSKTHFLDTFTDETTNNHETTHGTIHGSKNHTVLKVSTICRTNKCIFAKILGEYGIFQSILEPEIRPGFHIPCCASTTFQHRFNFIGGEDLIPNIEVVYSPYITYTQ